MQAASVGLHDVAGKAELRLFRALDVLRRTYAYCYYRHDKESKKSQNFSLARGDDGRSDHHYENQRHADAEQEKYESLGADHRCEYSWRVIFANYFCLPNSRTYATRSLISVSFKLLP